MKEWLSLKSECSRKCLETIIENDGVASILANIHTPTPFYFSFFKLYTDEIDISDETKRGIFLVFCSWLKQPTKTTRDWISFNILLVKCIDLVNTAYLVEIGLDFQLFYQDLLNLVVHGSDEAIVGQACNMINILAFEDDNIGISHIV